MSSLRRKLLRYARKELRTEFEERERGIQKVQLESRHVANTRCLPTRLDLLAEFPRGGTIVEAGVDNGDFSAEILSIMQPSKLHLVDAWGSERYHKGKQDAVAARFRQETENGQVEIHVGLSTEAVQRFDDASLDVVYIDTDHSYETTRAELRLYAPKVKPGGVLAGHDYLIGNWPGLVRYGVIEAVQEFCTDEGWEMVFLTMEQTTSPSFAIRRITA